MTDLYTGRKQYEGLEIPERVEILDQAVFSVTRERFTRACTDRRFDDAVIDLSIVLEVLFLDGDGDKAKTIARRGAALVASSPADFDTHYTRLRSFYRARNQIIHDGNSNPTITLKDASQYTLTDLRAYGFEFLRKALSLFLASGEIAMPKSHIVKQRDSAAGPFAARCKTLDNALF